MNVLIVDDSKAMRMIIRRTLRQAGFDSWDVTEATNGVEALEKIRATNYDLVMLDWNMPEMTGIEVLETLKVEKPDLTCGFITTEGTPELRQRATDAGAKFLVTKPFTEDSLKDSLQAVL